MSEFTDILITISGILVFLSLVIICISSIYIHKKFKNKNSLLFSASFMSLAIILLITAFGELYISMFTNHREVSQELNYIISLFGNFLPGLALFLGSVGLLFTARAIYKG